MFKLLVQQSIIAKLQKMEFQNHVQKDTHVLINLLIQLSAQQVLIARTMFKQFVQLISIAQKVFQGNFLVLQVNIHSAEQANQLVLLVLQVNTASAQTPPKPFSTATPATLVPVEPQHRTLRPIFVPLATDALLEPPPP